PRSRFVKAFAAVGSDPAIGQDHLELSFQIEPAHDLRHPVQPYRGRPWSTDGETPCWCNSTHRCVESRVRRQTARTPFPTHPPRGLVLHLRMPRGSRPC